MKQISIIFAATVIMLIFVVYFSGCVQQTTERNQIAITPADTSIVTVLPTTIPQITPTKLAVFKIPLSDSKQWHPESDYSMEDMQLYEIRVEYPGPVRIKYGDSRNEYTIDSTGPTAGNPYGASFVVDDPVGYVEVTCNTINSDKTFVPSSFNVSIIKNGEILGSDIQECFEANKIPCKKTFHVRVPVKESVETKPSTTPIPTPTPTIATMDTYLYKNKNSNFSMFYPVTWTVNETADGSIVEFIPPAIDGKIFDSRIIIEHKPFFESEQSSNHKMIPTVDLSNSIDAIWKELDNKPNIRTGPKEGTSTTVDNNPAYMIYYWIQDKFGNDLQSVHKTVAIVNSQEYIITSINEKQFGEEFKIMLDSFKFSS